MTTHNPSVETTIFPRINYIKTFAPRAVRRDYNGRIYGDFKEEGFLPEDEPAD